MLYINKYAEIPEVGKAAKLLQNLTSEPLKIFKIFKTKRVKILFLNWVMKKNGDE